MTKVCYYLEFSYIYKHLIINKKALCLIAEGCTPGAHITNWVSTTCEVLFSRLSDCKPRPEQVTPPHDHADMREGGIVRRLTRGQKKTVAERMFCHRSLCGDVPCCGCRIRIRLQHEKRDTYYCESFHIYLYSRSPQPLLGHRNNHLLSTTNNFERRILLHIPATRRRRLLWQP